MGLNPFYVLKGAAPLFFFLGNSIMSWLISARIKSLIERILLFDICIHV